VSGQRHAAATLHPRERPGTHCTGSWVRPRAGLDRCRKSRPHRDSIPGASSPYPVAIPTTLPDPLIYGGQYFCISTTPGMVLKSKGYLCGPPNFPISCTDASVGPFPHLGKNYLRKFTREIRLIIDMFSEKHVSLYKTKKENIKHFKSATGLESSPPFFFAMILSLFLTLQIDFESCLYVSNNITRCGWVGCQMMLRSTIDGSNK